MTGHDEAAVQRNWMLLLDGEDDRPGSEAPDAAAIPPVEAIVGGWLVDDDGTIGPFEANPLYRPRGTGSPTSPVDAAAKLVASEQADVGLVTLAMRDSLVDLALDETGEVTVAVAPDGVPCVVVASGALDRARVDAPQWRQVNLTDLLRLLPPGADVLVNPGGPRSMRLLADALRDLVGSGEDE